MALRQASVVMVIKTTDIIANMAVIGQKAAIKMQKKRVYIHNKEFTVIINCVRMLQGIN